MMPLPRPISAGLILVLACGSPTPPFHGTLINMVPNGRSGETNQDAEPTITVDPNNSSRMAGSAFTWDNLTGAANVTATAPIYVSSDAGSTWSLAFIVPSKIGSGFPTGDITLSFSSTLSGAPAHHTSWLYGGILSSAGSGLPMVALRAQDAFAPTVMAALDTRTGNVDQPHTIAKTSGAQDKVYIGFNNGYSCLAPSGRSSTVDVSQDGAAAAPTWTLDVIETRNSACQDGFAQVVAAHEDGTLYAAFIHDWSGTPRIVVVRDANWAIGPSPFTALQDPSDAVAGRFVTPGLTLAYSGFMGQNRLGASNVSIAVDPENSDRVYVAWGDANGANSETIHVRRSINQGVDWSDDLLTVTGAMNPEVAINDIGVVGVLYQSVTGGKWETRLTRSNNLDATTFENPGTLLASQSTTTPSVTYSPYIGDYASLVSSGDDFVGMFSASNYPDKANFLPGIAYQREVDWTAHKLYADAAHTVEVPVSIDPFFFSVRTTVCHRWKGFCNICKSRPHTCYPIFDPWWWRKCPMCGITIFVNPGEEVTRVTVFDSRGKEVGVLQRLPQAVIENGATYTHAIRLKQQEGVGYVLRAESAAGKEITGSFKPAYVVKLERAENQR
jgi:hypothetical protein